MARIITCPHCQGRINLNNLNKIFKVSRKNNSADFFDIEDQNQKEVEKLLNEKKIEFGQNERR